jgi:REP element-mobilizing transposase RayT
MIRGIEGITIFRDDEDREHFLSLIGQLVAKTGTGVIAWALMSNHVHLLFFSGQAGISTFMRKLLTRYATWFNRRHKRSGHLFQNRYKSIVCEEESYVLELVRYIHLNPLRGSAVKSLEELENYSWSGHSVLVGRKRREWQETEYVLGQFGVEKKRAIRAYRRFMDEGKDLGRKPELVGGGLIRSMGGWSRVLSIRGKGEMVEHDSRILGSGDFVQKIMREAEERLVRQMKNRGGQGEVEGVVKRMCQEGGVEKEEIRKGGRRRRVSKVRARIAYYLNRQMGISFAEIARNLGVGTSAIAMAIRKEDHDENN